MSEDISKVPRPFLQDLSGGAHIDCINRDIESAWQSGVTVAPALFVNGVRYRDRWNIEQLLTRHFVPTYFGIEP